MATTQYHIHILFFIISSFSYSLQDDACRILGCGEGRCVEDHTGLSYHCECNQGWKTMKVAPMPFPSCIVPNCTTDFPCGGEAPIPPPPPPRPPLSIINVCSLVWCGDDDCVANETRHYCRCHDDAATFLHSNSSICMKQCSLKEDCNHLGFDLVRPSSPPPPPPPPPSSSGSFDIRKNKVPYTLTKPIGAIFILMATGLAKI